MSTKGGWGGDSRDGTAVSIEGVAVSVSGCWGQSLGCGGSMCPAVRGQSPSGLK